MQKADEQKVGERPGGKSPAGGYQDIFDVSETASPLSSFSISCRNPVLIIMRRLFAC